ncbi:Kanadaptin [Thoreauomyces humboldtii]|nr:Kanadaptin [Thoreauomyces humboldtii]
MTGSFAIPGLPASRLPPKKVGAPAGVPPPEGDASPSTTTTTTTTAAAGHDTAQITIASASPDSLGLSTKSHNDPATSEASPAIGVQPESEAPGPRDASKLPPLPSHERPSKPTPEFPPLNYTTPEWSCAPQDVRYFEVLKNGKIVSTSPPITKAFLLAGRLPICDFDLEHASVSRYHAVVQFKLDDTAYVYDLGSSHGTFLNKVMLPKREYVRMRIGDMLRFGASTRMYILQGDKSEEELREEEEEEATAQEALRKRKAVATDRRAREEADSQQSVTEVSWGFGEDAVEEDDDEDAIDAPDNHNARPLDPDAYYHADPRKALRTWLEARGHHMTFDVKESGPGHARVYEATLDLPVDTAHGTPLQASGSGGRRRLAEIDAALDGCLKLDRRGVLRPKDRAEQVEIEKERKKKFADQDDDGDSFYDRTNAKPASATTRTATKAHTFESLTMQREDVQRQMEALEREIEGVRGGAGGDDGEADDEIDAFMTALRDKEANQAKEILRRKMVPLEREATRLDRLIKVVAPTGVAIPLSLLTQQPQSFEKTSTPTHEVKDKGKDQDGTEGTVQMHVDETVEPTLSKKPIPKPSSSTPKPTSLAATLHLLETTHPSSSSSSPAAPTKRSLSDGQSTAGDDPSDTAAVDAAAPAKKRRRVYGMMTESEVEKHEAVETEDAVDWIAPSGLGNDEVEQRNRDYGY